MAWRPSDSLVYERLQKYLGPGETLFVQAMGSEQPSFGWLLLLGSLASFFFRYYCLGVKETGLIITEVSMWGYGEKRTVVLPWDGIFDVAYEPGMLQDILTFRSGDGRRWQVRFQKLWGLTNNREAGKVLAQYIHTWSQAVQQQSTY